MQNIKILPYQPDTSPTSFKRAIVYPIPNKESTQTGVLIIASDINSLCEYGIVQHVCEGSELKPGDEVMYKKVNRNTSEHLDTISIDDKVCDVLYENEIWSANGHPFNRVFVQQISTSEVNEAGLLLPDSVKSVTQKGKVFRAPSHYTVKADDNIEYRKPERGIYPTIVIDGRRYDVLFESDIFTVNGRVAPFRIIVRIDKVAQSAKRTTTETGLIRSDLFQAMLFNMQVGKVLDIGEEAQKNYPDLRIGDSAIIHHSVESQDYRLINKVYSKKNAGTVLFEDRIINSFDANSRELFGRIANLKKMIISEFGVNDFLKWEFDVQPLAQHKSSELFDFETNVDKCHTLDALKSTLDHKKKEGHGKGHAKLKGYYDLIKDVDPNTNKDRYDYLETQINQAKSEAIRIGVHLDHNHLLRCTDLRGYDVLVTYKELYPINIYGHKYLIAHEDYIVSHIHTDKMGKTVVTPHADRILVRPIIEESKSELLAPVSAKEKPQKGEAVAVGPGKEGKTLETKQGDLVLFRKGSGIQVEVDGEALLIMREGIDTLATISLVAEASAAI